MAYRPERKLQIDARRCDGPAFQGDFGLPVNASLKFVTAADAEGGEDALDVLFEGLRADAESLGNILGSWRWKRR